LQRAVLSAKPSRHLLLTAAVAEFAELLRHSYWARDGSWAAVSKLLDEVLPLYPENREVEELAAMVKRAGTLAKPREAPPPEERPDLPK
jgi:hypothetical protein